MTSDDVLEIRLERQLSQEDMAKLLGVSRVSYRRLETGKNLYSGEPIEYDMRSRLAFAALKANIKPL